MNKFQVCVHFEGPASPVTIDAPDARAAAQQAAGEQVWFRGYFPFGAERYETCGGRLFSVFVVAAQ